MMIRRTLILLRRGCGDPSNRSFSTSLAEALLMRRSAARSRPQATSVGLSSLLAAFAGVAALQQLDRLCGCEADDDAKGNDEPYPRDDEAALDKKGIKVCGSWCSTAHPKAPCRMDERLIPCLGEHCRTTAGLWSLFMLGPRTKSRPVPCEMYKAGIAYPNGAVPCDDACTIPEIKKERYPLPTGLGVFCRPGTCSPGATPNPAAGRGLGTLQCPCNWFGSECESDWHPIRGVRKRRIGYLDHVTVLLDIDAWETVVADYRPGAVVRLNMKEATPDRNADGNHTGIYELACAVAKCDTPGEVEVLVAPPLPWLRWQVTHLNEYIRSLPVATKSTIPICEDMDKKKLFINPVISGFYNGRYEYLMDFLDNDDTAPRHEGTMDSVDQLVVLSTGAGLSGALSAIEAVVKRNHENAKSGGNRPLKVHLYHGLRDVRHLPFCDRIDELVEAGDLELTLVVSTSDRDDETGQTTRASASPWAVQSAALRGEEQKRNVTTRTGREKVYVQHVFEQDMLASKDKNPLLKTAVVVCGRMQVIDDARAILQRLSFKIKRGNPISTSEQLLEERLFLNI